MKWKQALRTSAKKTPSISTKNGNPTAKVISTSATSSTCDLDEVALLFNTIKHTKAQKDGSPAAAQLPPLRREVGGGSAKAHNPKHASAGVGVSPSSTSRGVQVKPVRDGLYHAPEKSVQMSDNQFFSGTWLKEDRNATAAFTTCSAVTSTGSPEVSEALQRREDVDRIVSMEELAKMLSRDARAGTTPNCPFDCDCCF
ncbi:Eukaryotic protein of unknown function (DUF1764), putative [Leishmania guyanensis]|uniref:Uncharacterized protein n=1 Tax=Leishmania guyanensis TaxID=5670 RepID=A0A1E1J632_LEIGU|nr:hypothetical protein, conserved [Leishmania guyanensis]